MITHYLLVGKGNIIMADIIKDFIWGMPLGLYIILFLSIGLLVAGFIVPPLGLINGSVLKGAALIIGGTWLLYVTANIPKFVESGAKIKASYGNAHIEIGRHKKQSVEVEKEDTDKKEMDAE